MQLYVIPMLTATTLLDLIVAELANLDSLEVDLPDVLMLMNALKTHHLALLYLHALTILDLTTVLDVLLDTLEMELDLMDVLMLMNAL